MYKNIYVWVWECIYVLYTYVQYIYILYQYVVLGALGTWRHAWWVVINKKEVTVIHIVTKRRPTAQGHSKISKQKSSSFPLGEVSAKIVGCGKAPLGSGQPLMPKRSRQRMRRGQSGSGQFSTMSWLKGKAPNVASMET